MTNKNGLGSMQTSSSRCDGPQWSGERLRVPRYFALKRPFMWCLALMGLVVLSPLMLLLYAAVRVTSSGPGFFWQRRVGKDGKVFSVVKFRTMYEDAEKISGPVWCSPNDPRITPVGRFYRFLHLDELPQLINVLRGEMCLIGPRPERPEIIRRDQLASEVSRYEDRCRVLPGITGLAQINFPPDESLNCVRRKVAVDLEYIESASLGLDIRILLCTAFRMIGVRHGYAVRLLKLGRYVDKSQLAAPLRKNGKTQKLQQLFHPADYLINGESITLRKSVLQDGDWSVATQLDTAESEDFIVGTDELNFDESPPKQPR